MYNNDLSFRTTPHKSISESNLPTTEIHEHLLQTVLENTAHRCLVNF